MQLTIPKKHCILKTYFFQVKYYRSFGMEMEGFLVRYSLHAIFAVQVQISTICISKNKFSNEVIVNGESTQLPLTSWLLRLSGASKPTSLLLNLASKGEYRKWVSRQHLR